jgi:hypothetical protein
MTPWVRRLLIANVAVYVVAPPPLGMLGLVMASTFVLYRQATAFSNLLEYPVWLVSGLLIPISLLPGWVEPISWLLIRLTAGLMLIPHGWPKLMAGIGPVAANAYARPSPVAGGRSCPSLALLT